MKKKIVITSLILILVPSVLFSVLYGFMSYVIYHSGEDYSEQVIGEWVGIQYLDNKQKIAFDESNYIILNFDKDTLHIEGTLLEAGDYNYKWDTGSIARVTYNNKDCIFVISINSLQQLKVTINAYDYIITLTRAESENVPLD